MPAYRNSPYQNPILLQKGVPVYLFGAFSQLVGNTRMTLATDAIATNVATITGQFMTGPLPKAGDLVSIINSANSSGAFNVNRATIASVAYVAATNVMTLTFALTASNQSATADGGTVIIEPGEVPEAIAAQASIACLVQAPEGDSQFTLPVSVTFPTAPTSCTVDLQAALRNNSAEFTTIVPAIAVVAGSAQTIGPFSQVTLQRGYVYRFNVSALSGTGTICAKIG